MQALARGFEGKAWATMSAALSAAEDKGLHSSIKDVIQAVTSIVGYLVENGVLEIRYLPDRDEEET